MVDIHAHILPGLDDGSEDINETLDMLEMAAESGVEIIAATSHGNVGYYTKQEYLQALRDVRRAVQKEQIPIQVVAGMEIFASDDMVELLEDDKLLTLNQTRNVLMEFSFQEEPWVMQDHLKNLLRAGYRPIVAHPERYICIQQDPSPIYHWSRMGCVFQCNKGSFLGRFGKAAYHTVMSLMDHRLVHCIGSDAHGIRSRTTFMDEIQELLLDMASEEERDRLLVTNPTRILGGKDVVRLEELEY